ncbi:helix-turn-helix domain-containing protein [Halodesulfovibrio aestuarii]|uniref:helix-turn-helix domain-containing protein n=1 Tax=Halodesulfovibrio aestuarii TaxID=126333 RepID=UPI003D337F0C
MSEKEFKQRLRDVIYSLKIEDRVFAKTGGISKATLSGYFNSERLPKQDALSAWVTAYNINANWLLTGTGNMFLGEEADAQTKSHGKPVQVTDPIAQRLETATRLLKETGASPEVIQQAIMKILDSQNEPHTQAEANTLDAPAFADKCERGMKRT